MKTITFTDEFNRNMCELFDIPYQPMKNVESVIESVSVSAFKGKNHTDEAKKDIREANIGSKNPMFGKKGVLNHFYGQKKKQVTCPHCNKIGGVNVMVRWHFDKCKHK